MSHARCGDDNELRFDPVDGAYTLIAPDRRARPVAEVIPNPGERALWREARCIFCDDSAKPPPTLLDAIDLEDETFWALPSPTPLFLVEPTLQAPRAYTPEPALGAHELLVWRSAAGHHRGLAQLSETVLGGILRLCRRRLDDLSRDFRLERYSVSISDDPLRRLLHTHAALVCRPERTAGRRPSAEREARGQGAPAALTEDLSDARKHARIVIEHEDIVAYVPFAPRQAGHLRVALAQPGHARFLDALAALGPLASVLRRAIGVSARFCGGPLSVTAQEVRLGSGSDDDVAHPHFDVVPKFGSDDSLAAELGLRISPASPEWLATTMREVAGRLSP